MMNMMMMMMSQPKIATKSLKTHILGVQGRSRSSMLVPAESSSAVLVMICSKSVSICNHSRATLVSNSIDERTHKMLDNITDGQTPTILQHVVQLVVQHFTTNILPHPNILTCRDVGPARAQHVANNVHLVEFDTNNVVQHSVGTTNSNDAFDHVISDATDVNKTWARLH